MILRYVISPGEEKEAMYKNRSPQTISTIPHVPKLGLQRSSSQPWVAKLEPPIPRAHKQANVVSGSHSQGASLPIAIDPLWPGHQRDGNGLWKGD